MPITQFTNIPGRGQDPSTFAARADHFLGTQIPRFVGEANAMAEEMNTDALEVAQAAVEARASADMAALAVEGRDNYRGEWSALSGPLTPPASVRHNGRFWLLTAALPNVALAEPGVDLTKWQPVKRGAIVTAASVAALPGDDIVSTATAAVTVTLPAGPSAGDCVAITSAGGGLVTVARNGSTIGDVAQNEIIDMPSTRFVFIYAGGTWRICMEGLIA